jgi:lipoyl(octanoyl) transferase
VAARTLEWAWLGRVDYADALALQELAVAGLRRGERPEQLLLLEHPHVYTLGRNAAAADVVAAGDWLRARGIEVVETNRGGQVTYHGPGQLVGYPILDLAPDRRDIRRYVADLQEMLARAVGEYGVAARPGGDSAAIGVWVGQAKLASIGVHISRWITSHGFALNVATDLSYFSGIVPCGLRGVEMTSLERLLGRRLALAEVAATCARQCAEVFGRALAAAPPAGAVPEVAR